MKISVIGARGFIGKALCAELERQGHDIHAPARDQQSSPAGGWGHLVWAAGLTANFRERPFDTVQAHVSDLMNVLRSGSCDSLLYLSSTRVYQRSADTFEDAELPCLSSDPSDLYNLSKLMGESLCLNAGVPRVKVARLSNILGPCEADRATFVGALSREAAAGQITLQTAPSSAKDYLWISDAAHYLAAMAVDDTVGIFNVARGAQIPHEAWATAIAGQFGATVNSASSAVDGGFLPISVRKLQSLYGAAKVDPLQQVAKITQSASASQA